MDKDAAIVDHLRLRYNPVAVVLHGSRAVGRQRPHSDWDIFLLVTEPRELAVDREDIAGEDVEWQACVVPVADHAILDTFGVQLQFAKLLWEDASGAGSALLRQAARFYAQGVRLTEAKKRRYQQYLNHKANGMADDMGTPCLFLRHQYALLERASNWWFEMRGQYRKPFYLAMPIIQQQDPAYHELLLALSAGGPTRATIAAARSLIARLFAADGTEGQAGDPIRPAP